jgi:hypothetical protein
MERNTAAAMKASGEVEALHPPMEQVVMLNGGPLIRT